MILTKHERAIEIDGDGKWNFNVYFYFRSTLSSR